MIEGAVEALSLEPGAVVADVGFGGGVRLRLLLDSANRPTVRGVEVSFTMISQAHSMFAEDCATERLHIDLGQLTDLPLGSASLDSELTAALARANLELTDHRRVGGGRVPSHLFIAAHTGDSQLT